MITSLTKKQYSKCPSCQGRQVRVYVEAFTKAGTPLQLPIGRKCTKCMMIDQEIGARLILAESILDTRETRQEQFILTTAMRETALLAEHPSEWYSEHTTPEALDFRRSHLPYYIGCEEAIPAGAPLSPEYLADLEMREFILAMYGRDI